MFLFDEPLSNLDAKLRVQMRAEISKLHRRLGATMIYVTHDQVEAMTLADRIFIMNKGVLQQVGAPMEVYEQPANRFVAGFIGTPAMNFVDARVVATDGGSSSSMAAVSASRCPNLSARTLAPYAGQRGGVRCPARRTSSLRSRRGADGDAHDHARAEVVETLGSEIFAHLTCGAHSLVARMDVPESPFRVGETLQIDLEDGQYARVRRDFADDRLAAGEPDRREPGRWNQQCRSGTVRHVVGSVAVPLGSRVFIVMEVL